MNPSDLFRHGLAAMVVAACMWPSLAWSAPIDDAKAAIARKDYASAAATLLPLANGGNAEAQRLVGELCFSGQGFPKDLKAAFQWTQVAAENKDAIGEYNLGHLYENGLGVAASATEARRWYLRSARQGYVLAQRRLGELLEDSSPAQAANWYEAAMLQGDAISRDRYKVIGGAINRESQRVAAAEKEREAREKEAASDAEYEAVQREFRRKKAISDAEMSSYSTADVVGAQIRKNAAQAQASLEVVGRAAAAVQAAQAAQAARAAEKARPTGAPTPEAHAKQETARPAQVQSSTQPQSPTQPQQSAQPQGTVQAQANVPQRPSAPQPQMPASTTTARAASPAEKAPAARAAPAAPAVTVAKANANAESVKPQPHAEAAKEKPEIEWGPIRYEALAVCYQSKKTGKWACNGPLDNQIIVDEPSLASALARQRCEDGSWAAGGPTIDGQKWEAYRCGRALEAGDYDIAKRYGLITASRAYMCPKLQPGRCTTYYAGQDKRAK